jgi:hypothetical protein
VLETYIQELRNPRLVIYNIPEYITLDNATKNTRKLGATIGRA